MMMDFSSGEGHGATNILNLNPRAGKICRPFKL